MDILKKTSWTYMTGTLFLTILLFVVTIFIKMEDYGFISAIFHILCSTAYIWGWLMLSRRSPETLPKYYLAGSAFRLMAAAAVLLVFCVIQRHDTEAIKCFSVVFIVFYLVMLAFDALFFAKISNYKKITK
jgi:hypothetical protein